MDDGLLRHRTMQSSICPWIELIDFEKELQRIEKELG